MRTPMRSRAWAPMSPPRLCHLYIVDMSDPCKYLVAMAYWQLLLSRLYVDDHDFVGDVPGITGKMEILIPGEAVQPTRLVLW
jgi:hypothetical protein